MAFFRFSTKSCALKVLSASSASGTAPRRTGSAAATLASADSAVEAAEEASTPCTFSRAFSSSEAPKKRTAVVKSSTRSKVPRPSRPTPLKNAAPGTARSPPSATTESAVMPTISRASRIRRKFMSISYHAGPSTPDGHLNSNSSASTGRISAATSPRRGH